MTTIDTSCMTDCGNQLIFLSTDNLGGLEFHFGSHFLPIHHVPVTSMIKTLQMDNHVFGHSE